MFTSAEPPSGSIFYYYAYSKVNSKNRLKLTAVEATTSSKENRNRPPIKSFFLVAEVAASGKEEILWIVMS